jgi:hypothetical protein
MRRVREHDPKGACRFRKDHAQALKHNQVLGQHGGDAMTGHAYDKATTALLFVDPYNDFLSEGGKVWPRLKDIAIEVGLAR